MSNLLSFQIIPCENRFPKNQFTVKLALKTPAISGIKFSIPPFFYYFNNKFFCTPFPNSSRNMKLILLTKAKMYYEKKKFIPCQKKKFFSVHIQFNSPQQSISKHNEHKSTGSRIAFFIYYFILLLLFCILFFILFKQQKNIIVLHNNIFKKNADQSRAFHDAILLFPLLLLNVLLFFCVLKSHNKILKYARIRRRFKKIKFYFIAFSQTQLQENKQLC